jgi:hypothetical protein
LLLTVFGLLLVGFGVLVLKEPIIRGKTRFLPNI